jgi:hypothetical protein
MAGLSGRVAGGAQRGLAEVMAQQSLEAERIRQAAIQDAQMQLQQQRLSEDIRQSGLDEAHRTRTFDAGERDRRDRANQAGLRDMYEQREILDTEENNRAIDAMASDPSLPPEVRTVVGLRRRGVTGVNPEDVADPKQALTRDVERARAIAEAQYGTAAKYRAPADERLVQIMGPQGTPIWVKESQAEGQPAAQAPRAVTGQERQVLAFYNRAKQASDDIGGLEDSMAQSGMGAQLQQQFAPNMFQTEQQQRYRQAQRAFTEARLRKESGAAIPTAEYENDARTYFAQPGDSPEVIQQKRQARQVVLDGLKFASGKAHNEFYGDDGGSTPTSPSSNPPQIGAEKVFPNGKKGRWDGKGWVAVP